MKKKKHRGGEDIGDRFFAWDHKLRLPSPPPTVHRLHYTTNDDNKDEEECGGRLLAWDHKLQLQSPPPTGFNRLRVIRPPLLFAQQHDNVDKQFEHAWLHALQCRKSSNKCPDNGSDQHAA
jgi:hypothetical protein